MRISLDLASFESSANPKITITPCFGRFSISSEILIDFGLTFFMVLT